MSWVGIVYCGECNYYVLINSYRYCVRGEFIQNYFKMFNFLLIWDKNLRSPTGLTIEKTSLDTSLMKLKLHGNESWPSKKRQNAICRVQNMQKIIK